MSSNESLTNQNEPVAKNVTKSLQKDLKEGNKTTSSGTLPSAPATNLTHKSPNTTKTNLPLLENGKARNVIDLTLFSIFTMVGIGIFIFRIFQKNENYAKSLNYMQYKIKPRKNPFVGLGPQDLDSITSNTSRMV
jgi:hypothetical protein